MAYNGPGNPALEAHPYVFMLFKQGSSSDITISQDYVGASNLFKPFNIQQNLLTLMQESNLQGKNYSVNNGSDFCYNSAESIT